ncbi:MAG: repair protein RadC protein [Candidatus Amesbacteria bacterium GW2011_GWA2_42_12]|uniref:Repair protein RadC protein n=1 Tax=Candidatus Amesbacteria bacterium GW2011_GWA2_42_12 TaxID=1618356 RepID=A0A0G1A9P7_9BACT|nr:MAG: repair protein RadC protein [Candidatus Amesbacteria bacterium GW2011_GWA2_42_12]
MAKLKSLAKIDLPREKLEKYGPTKLEDYELLAILLGSGIKGKNVLTLAKSILQKVNEVGPRISTQDIRGIKGVGSVRAIQIIAILELSARLTDPKPEVLSSKDIWNLCSDIRNSKREHFLAFFLDTQSRLIERQIISVGTLSTSLIHPRELFEPAITLHAASIVIAHNHPSGSLDPSDSDIKITKILEESGKLLGIPLEKHVIVTSVSFQAIPQKNLNSKYHILNI